jgi:hypothetical protein
VKPSAANKTAYAILVLAAGLKFTLLAFVIPPLMQPDSIGYITFANQFMTGWEWFWERNSTSGEDTYRTIGYPAVIAAGMWIFGDGWEQGVIGFQIVLGLAASILLYRFASLALDRWWLGLLVAVGYTFSLALVYEFHILTDALYGHLIVITIATLGLIAMRPNERATHILIPAVALGLAFLIRDFTLYMLPVFVVLVFVAVVRRRNSLAAKTAMFVTVLVPVILLSGAYASWNEHRTGERFITTGARTAALLPLVRFAGQGVPIFDQDTPLDEAARASLSTYFYADVLNINRYLEQKGLQGLEMSRLARDRFMQTLAEHPLIVARHVLRELRFLSLSQKLINPLNAYSDIAAFRENRNPEAFRDRMLGALASSDLARTAFALAELAVVSMILLIGLTAYIVFPLVYLTMLATRRNIEFVWHVLASTWICFIGAAVCYGIIRLEARYLIGFAPFMVILPLKMTLSAMFNRRPSRSNAAAS